ARRAQVDDLDFVRREFGSSILYDMSYIASWPDDIGSPELALAICIDQATQLILNFGFGMARDALDLQRRVAAASLTSAIQLGANRVAELGAIHIVYVIGPADAVEVAKVAGAVRRHVPGAEVIDDGPRRYGRRLVSILGSEFGREIRFRPRIGEGRPKSPSRGSTAEEQHAFLQLHPMVVAAVRNHNDPIEQRLYEAGVAAPYDRETWTPLFTKLSLVKEALEEAAQEIASTARMSANQRSN
ncbi:MAG: hypothetical protein ACRYG4_19425, partial [Janthinobacterium lividum]